MLTNLTAIISQYIHVSNQAVHLKSVIYQLYSIKLGQGVGGEGILNFMLSSPVYWKGRKGREGFPQENSPTDFFWRKN